TFTIDKADSTVAVSCPDSRTFTGEAIEPCSAAATGAAGLNATLSVSYSGNVNAGTASAAASYAGDGNHKPATGSATFTVAKAGSTGAVGCPPSVTYTGSALEPCTAKATGVGGLSADLDVSYSENTNAGTANAVASYGGDANHNGSSGSSTFAISKAPSSVKVTCPATQTYTGSALAPCSAKVTGAGGLNDDVAVSYTGNLNAGTANASASFAGDANHDGSSDSATFTIEKASSTVALDCPASRVYTGAPIEPCTASVSGIGGLNQAISVGYDHNTTAGTATASATYGGDANHTGSSDSKTFTIDKADSTVTISCPDSRTFTGEAIEPCSAAATGAGGLNATLSVSYSGNVNAGTASASASYAGDGNHKAATGSATFTIAKAASTVSVDCTPSVTYTGSALEPCTATATGVGGLSADLNVSYSENTNAGTANAVASYGGDANHDGSSGSSIFAI